MEQAVLGCMIISQHLMERKRRTTAILDNLLTLVVVLSHVFVDTCKVSHVYHVGG
jgi:hypothetical protein